MADEPKEEMTDPLGNEEAQAEPQASSGELEKSPEEAAQAEAGSGEVEKSSEEAAQAEAGSAKSDESMRVVEQETAAHEPPVESGPENDSKNLDLLLDVNLQITVELGRKDMSFGDILKLGRGSIVELNKMADEPVDIYVNQSKIAHGEVVVVDEHFGVRVTKLLSSARMKN